MPLSCNVRNRETNVRKSRRLPCRSVAAIRTPRSGSVMTRDMDARYGDPYVLTKAVEAGFEPLSASNTLVNICLCGLEQSALALGDDLGHAVDHADGGVIVDRVGPRRDPCRPLLRVDQGSVGVIRVLKMRDHGKVNESRSLSRDQDSVDVTLR